MAATRQRFDVFVSYSHADNWVKQWLIPGLKRHGLEVCVDYADFRPWEAVVDEIARAVAQSRFTIHVVTPSYLRSIWTQFERTFSVHLTVTRQSRIIPLLLEQVELPLLLQTLVSADFTRADDRDYQLEKLATQIRNDTESEPAAPEKPPARSHYRNFNVELQPSDGNRYQLTATSALPQLITLPSIAGIDAVRAGTADRGTCQSVGQTLYRTIFTPEVHDAWNRAEETAGGDGVLRLRLRLGDERAAALPWELLHNDRFFLTTTRHYPVVRNSADVTMYGHDGARVNVLVADLTKKENDVEQDIDTLREQLEKLRDDGRVGELRILASATLSDLQDALSGGRFQILHVIGEGEEGAKRLLLRGQKRTRAVDGEMFGYLVRESPVCLLLFTATNGTSLAGVAEGVNRTGVPATVAMQGTVSRDAAREFWKRFYRVLGDGCPIETCVADGRKAIMTQEGLDNPQWAYPVLFNDDPGALLFGGEPSPACFGLEPVRREEKPAAKTARHNIPEHFHRPLVGRGDVLRKARTALDAQGPNNVILLKSAAGFGKSAVARELAWQSAQRRDGFDSVTWVSADDITPDGIALAVVTTLGARHLMTLDASARIGEMKSLFAAGRHLVVIDDISVAAQTAVRDFIGAMPRNVQFILTSSRRIGIGEQELEIGPLAKDDAAKLGQAGSAVLAAGNPFVIIAETARAEAGLGQEIAFDAASTAAYIGALLPSLPQEWQRVLAVCATLPFAAAAPIIDGAAGIDAGSATATLVKMGLLEQHGERVALASTLRTLFRDGDDAALRALPNVTRACVETLSAFLEQSERQAGNHDSPEYGRLIEPELPNLLWSMRTAYAIGMFARLTRFRDLLHDTLYRLGSWTTSIELGELAFFAGDRTNDPVSMAWAALYPLVRIHYHRGNLREAERWCAVARAIFASRNHRDGTIAAKRYLGRIRQSAADYDGARAIFRDVLALSHEPPRDPQFVGTALANLAALEQAAGNIDEAEKLYLDALAEYEPGGRPASIGPTLHALGRLKLSQSDAKGALDFFERARTVLSGEQWRNRFARISASMGLAYEQLGDYDAALDHLRAARDIFAELGAQPELVEADIARDRVSALRGARK